jgi:ATP-binding cassette subfamily B protein
MYFQAFQKGLGYLRDLLGNLAGLYEGNLFLSNLFDFLDIKPSVIDPPEPKPFPSPLLDGIVFDHVSFGYPSGNSEALVDISLSLRQGEILALVGENGSGKTTMVKLLCRLYDPDSGMITIDKIPLTDFRVAELRGNISVVFQDYVRYHLTAAQNISLGDIRRSPDRSAIREAAITAGVDSLIADLPDGYNTVLGRWFKGGKELSTGEWQKIALARAFIRNAAIVILDEPTSAQDAESEQDVFNKFRELASGKTAIVISHRFSTVRMADRIAVMHKGRIIEHGTHQELMNSDGMYRKMYSIQANAYS